MATDKKIILYPNVHRDIALKMTQTVRETLLKSGRSVAICPDFDDETTYDIKTYGIEISDLTGELPLADMLITFGGDGTILRAARTAAEYEVPILGINMGSKGFMAELETFEIDLIESVAAGRYEIETRMMLDAELIRNGEVIHREFALNDVVIRGYNKVIGLTLFGDGQIISSFVGDGAVIATPTGSTAYSMSAGGPIVEPTAYNIIVTPICAHAIDTKPFVLVSERHVTVEIGYEKHSPAYISADGCDRVDIYNGDIVSIKKSEKYTRLVRLSERSFYSKVSEKLGERP